jgi:hypothetical protein
MSACFYDLFSRDGIAPKIEKVSPLSRIEDAYHHLNSNRSVGSSSFLDPGSGATQRGHGGEA